MSIPLPQVNLAGVSVGQTGSVSFANIGIGAGGVSANPANTKNAGTILIFNESGSGLLIQFKTSQAGIYVPAGAWQPVPILAGETGFTWTVLYNLPNPPVTLLLVTYYYPNESLPSQPTLGNSPIGIGGTVSTSNVSTLSNEGNSSQTLIIDIGQTGHTLLITINSDGSASWSVLQSGTAHTIFNIETSGNPLQIGQAADITEILGKLTVDQLVTCISNLLMPNNTAIQVKDSGGTVRDVLLDDTTDQVILKGNAGPGAGHGAVVIQSDTNAAWKILQGSGGVALLDGTLNFLSGSISRLNGATSACGSGTVISHGLGVSPTILVLGVSIAQPGSATSGQGSATTTTFTATVGAGTGLSWLAGTS